MSFFLLIVYSILPKVSLKKPSLHEYELSSANYMPFTNPVICQKGFVTLYELSSPNNMPCVCHILYHILYLCYLNMSSFLLIACNLLAPFSIKKLCYNISCSSLTPFTAKKALLSHMSSFLLIACPLLAQVSITNPFLPYELFSASCMPFTDLVL